MDGSYAGVVGVTARMGIITCILYNVSYLCFRGLFSRLTIALDMVPTLGDNLRHSSSQSLDRSDGRFPPPKTMRRRRLFVRNRLELSIDASDMRSSWPLTDGIDKGTHL